MNTHLAGILSARLDIASAEHCVDDHGLVGGGATLGIGDDGHHSLLQDTGGAATLSAQSPAGDNGLLVVERLCATAGQAHGSH